MDGLEGMEIIEEVGKGKSLKKFLPFIIAGGALGLFFLLTKNKSSGGEVAQTTQSQDDTANYINDSMQETNQKLENFAGGFGSAITQQSEDISLLDNNIKNITDMQNTKLDLLQESIQDLQTKQSEFTPVTKEDVQAETPTKIEEITEVAPTTIYNELPKLSNSESKVYLDTLNLGNGPVNPYSEPVPTLQEKIQEKVSPSSTKSSTTMSSISNTQVKTNSIMTPILNSISNTVNAVKNSVGLGNNGEGKRDDVALNNRLATDIQFKNSELERTKQVIENRKKEGLDTSVQEKYLAKLKG